MKKTLLLTLEYPPQIGGVANYYEHLVRELPRDAIRVLDNEKNQFLSFPFWPHWLSAFWHTWRMIRKEKIEYILVGQVLPLGTVAFIFSYLLKIPYGVMTHAMDVLIPQHYPRKHWLMRRILERASFITTVSHFTKNVLEKFLGTSFSSKIHIIYPCPHITPESMAGISSVISHEKKVLLSVGRLVYRKGFDRVLQVLPDLLKHVPNLIYYIIGDGPERKRLEEKARGLPVIFLGPLKDEELFRYYSMADVFVMPARNAAHSTAGGPARNVLQDADVEGFGMVYLEANAFGKPVVGGKIGGIEDAVIDGKTGFLVDPEDPRMLQEALQKLFEDKNLAKKLGEQGRLRIKEIFQWNQQAQKLLNLLS